MKEQFLQLLIDSKKSRESKEVELDYQKLYELSKQHQVTALIYNQIYKFSHFPADLKNQWKKETLKMNAIQAIKTERFLKIYNSLMNNDLKVIVIKGIICRSLYPIPDNRPSNDEDLYIQKKDYDQVKKVLLNEGLIIVNTSKDVTTFLDQVSGLSIELHTLLFSKKSKAYGKYQKVFNNAFDTMVVHNINNQDIYSLSYDLHLLFLFLHFTKHFLHGGVGIRQLLDILIYIESYHDKFDWKYIYEVLDELNLQTFILNALGVGAMYLKFSFMYVDIPEEVNILDNEELLDDILDAGVFGKSSMERLHSSTMTLNATATGKTNILRSIFPSSKELSGRYTYLDKHPYLLPIAWVNRIFHYVVDKNGDRSKTIEMGNKRIELLKKYKIIN